MLIPGHNRRLLGSPHPAFSITEMVMAIAIMGIIAAIVISGYGDLQESSRTTLANERVEMLNRAMSSYAIANREIVGTPLIGSDQDEQLILMTLQMREAGALTGPFVTPTYLPVGSSNPNDYRMRFNGVRFELIPPGTAGTGLRVDFDGSDFGPARVFPPNFKPFGR